MTILLERNELHAVLPKRTKSKVAVDELGKKKDSLAAEDEDVFTKPI